MRKTTAVLAKAAIGICFASGLFAQGLFAQENSADLFADFGTDSTADSAVNAADTATTSTAAAFKVTFSGTHGFEYHAPAYWSGDGYGYEGSLKEPAFTNDIGVEVKEGDVKLVSRWGVDISPLSADAQNPNASQNESVTVTPYENFISWSPAAFKFTAGYQIFSWGVADRKNPTDNLNPKDYTAGVNADKIPVLAFDTVWYPTDSMSVEGVLIPSKSASEYPQDFSALVAANSSGQLTTADLSYAENTDPEDFVAGIKVNLNSANVDLSLDYLYDLDSYYTPSITLTTGTGPFAGMYVMDTVALERKRIHRFGGDAKTTIGKFGLWLEGAYNLTENSGSGDYSVRDSKIEYTLGSDVNYGPNDSFYVNFQYFGSWIPGYETDAASQAMISMTYGTLTSAQEYYERAMVNMLGLETEGLMQGVTCNLKWELADAAVTPQVTAVYAMPFQYDDAEETRYGALVLNPEIDIKPVDSFHIKLGADLYYAWHKVKGDNSVTLDTTTNAIGTYTTSNNVYIKVEYKWNADLKK